MISTLTSKCQTTIPKEVRDHLHIGPGNKVKWFTLPDGRVQIIPVMPVSSLRGIVKTKKRVTLEEMDAAIAEGANARYRRFLKQK